MVQCPSCARRQQPRLVCPDCGSPIAAELDCFAALGLPRRLTIEPLQVERVYYALGRRLHPDHFAAGPKAVLEASLKATALLTRSYRTLRDPASRGLYWLELNGEKLAENNKQVPSEIANLVFEVQEQLAELRRADGADRAGARDLLPIEQRRSELQAAMERTHQELARNFARWDQGKEDRAPLIGDLKTILSRIAYLRTLIRDVDRALDDAKQAQAARG